MADEDVNKSENEYDILFSNQKINLDNTICITHALRASNVQISQNAVTGGNIVAENAVQSTNLTLNNVSHLSNALNAMVVRLADLAADKQWNESGGSDDLYIYGLPEDEEE